MIVASIYYRVNNEIYSHQVSVLDSELFEIARKNEFRSLQGRVYVADIEHAGNVGFVMDSFSSSNSIVTFLSKFSG